MQCTVNYAGNLTKSDSSELQVLTHPVVEIHPITLSTYSNDAIQVHCINTNPNSVTNSNIVWFQDGIALQSSG